MDDRAAVDLNWLDDLAAQRAQTWTGRGATWSVTHGKPTDKPAAWLDIESPTDSGRLIVWVSGEAEMEWAALRDLRSTDARLPVEAVGQKHYEFSGRAALERCIDDFEGHLGLRT